MKKGSGARYGLASWAISVLYQNSMTANRVSIKNASTFAKVHAVKIDEKTYCRWRYIANNN